MRRQSSPIRPIVTSTLETAMLAADFGRGTLGALAIAEYLAYQGYRLVGVDVREGSSREYRSMFDVWEQAYQEAVKK